MKLGARYPTQMGGNYRESDKTMVDESVEFLTAAEETDWQTNGVPANRYFGWRDILGKISTHRPSGATVPTFEQIDSTIFYAYNFAVNDYAFINFHIPHDYVPGSDVYFHAHWLSNGTDTADVVWEFEYAYSDGYGNGVFALATPGTATATESSVSGTAYTHYVTESVATTIASGAMEPDGIIKTRIRRVTNGAVDNTDGIYIIEADLHYQSTNWATENRTSPFNN